MDSCPDQKRFRVGTKVMNEATPGNGAQIENLRTHTFENVKVGPNSVVELRSTSTNLEFSRLDYVEVTPKSVMIDNVSPDLGDTAPFSGGNASLEHRRKRPGGAPALPSGWSFHCPHLMLHGPLSA